MGDFRKLQVWQKSKELAVKIYGLSKTQLISKDYGFKDQLQRSTVSIPANIAEGDELGSDKQAVRHFYIARGSSAELQTLLIVANEIGYAEKNVADELVNDCRVISVMLTRIIKSRT